MDFHGVLDFAWMIHFPALHVIDKDNVHSCALLRYCEVSFWTLFEFSLVLVGR
jgi:hypothetical protein